MIVKIGSTVLVSVILNWVLIKLSNKWRIGKRTERRESRRKISRLGGISIIFSFFIILHFTTSISPPILPILIGSVIVFLLGLLDDLKSLLPHHKLIFQLLASTIVIYGGVRFKFFPHWIGVPLSFLWIVGITNAFNLIDGLDGLAGGIGVIISSIMLGFGMMEGGEILVNILPILIGALLGFLVWNFPPAKIFMGDSGSYFIGFILASLSIIGTKEYVGGTLSSVILPVMLFGYPIFDTTFVTILRMVRGASITKGNIDHSTHRLMILGMSERKIVALFYLLSILTGLCIFAYNKHYLLFWGIIGILVPFGEIMFYFLSHIHIEEEVKSYVSLIKDVFHKLHYLQIIGDSIGFCGAYILALFIGEKGETTSKLVLLTLGVVMLIRLGCITLFKFYQGTWKKFDAIDGIKVVGAIVSGTVLYFLIVTLIIKVNLSMWVFTLDTIFSILILMSTRILLGKVRIYLFRGVKSLKRVVIMGIHKETKMLVEQMLEDPTWGYKVVGFVDKDGKNKKKSIWGLEILGGKDEILEIVKKFRINEVILTKQDWLDTQTHQELEKMGVNLTFIKVDKKFTK